MTRPAQVRRLLAESSVFDGFTTEPWMAKGRCVGQDPEDWFPYDSRLINDDSVQHARLLCAHCPVAQECLTYAVEYPGFPALVGIWAGTTQHDRAPAVKKYNESRPRRIRHRRHFDHSPDYREYEYVDSIEEPA